MRRVSNGYTILEVSIFLAISLAIAAASWKLIGGKQAETDFNQKMRDTQSKIQDWINDVSTGNTGGDPTKQKCIINGSLPEVRTGGPTTNPVCIFLGKAIQFTDNSPGPYQSQNSSLYVYSVVGCRLKACPTTPGPTDVEPTNLVDASPKASDGPLPSLDLTETFSLAPAYVSRIVTGSHLIGFFNSLDTQNLASSNGAEDIDAYMFPYTSNAAKATTGNQIDKCLQLIGSCIPGAGGNPPALTSFAVCLTDGIRTAEITITSSGGVGAQTDLLYVSC